MGRIEKLKQQYICSSAPVKASIWFVVCNILQKGISVISTPIFTRLLSTEEYGVYSVYQSWYSIIAIFATLNLYCGVFNNGLTKYPDDKHRFTSSMQGLSTLCTMVLFVIYILRPSFWNSVLQLDTIFIGLIFIELLFVPAYQFWAVRQRYEYKYKSLVFVTMFMSIASPIIGVVAVINTRYKAEARVFAYVLVQVAIGLVLYIINAYKGKKLFVKEYWKYALLFNIPLVPHYLSQIVLQQADRIMINNMVGTGEAAIYSVAYTLSTLMLIVTNAINNSFVPYCYKKLKSGDMEDIRNNSNILLFVVGICCLLVVMLGPELISMLATKEYSDAKWIIPPVAASVYFMFLYNIFGNVEFYYEYTKFTMFASCIAAVLNVALNYVCIGMFGYIAAGYTTLVCYIIYSLAHGLLCGWISKKKIHNEIYDMKAICVFSTILVAVILAFNILYLTMIIRYAIIICGVILAIAYRKRIMLIIDSIKNLKK